MQKKRIRRISTFNIFNYTILTLFSLFFIIPVFIVVTSSLVTDAELIQKGGFVFLPDKLDFGAYRVIISTGSVVLNGYKITIIRTIIGTAFNLLFTTGLAYGLSKKRLWGRNTILTMIFFTMIFGGGLIPTFILVDGLRLTNTIWALVFPGLVSAWWMIIMKNFFSALPDELEDSARIDGANDIVIFFRIILPISTATLATFGLFYAVGHWNAWFDALIYIRKTALRPLALILRGIVISGSMTELSASENFMAADKKPPTESIRAAAIVVSVGPIIMIYPFIQKYFVKGIMIGAIKG